MNLRQLLLLTTSVVLLTACDRNSGEAQRLAEERAALEKEKAQLATDRATAERAATEQERAKLESERAAFAAEKARLAGDKEAQARAENEARLAAEREKRMTAERRAADADAQRTAAEIREREAREAAQDAASQARAEQSVDFFYDALDPYGDWVQVEGRGYCWRPHVDRGWRPYTDGGWVSTDYGWTWRSNEPFGWAVYHYGRWTHAPRLGWIWVPGTEWGPAWVSWRRSDEYVGWAPLPPDAYSASGFTASVDSYFDIGPGLYAFLRVADFGEPTYVGRVVQPEQNVTIIHQTVNVTNVTYQTVQNRVSIVNRGPDLTVINQHSRRPVQHLAIERVNAGAPTAAKPAANTLRLIAPALNAKPAITKPKQVKDQVKATELEHGWAEAKGDALKIRERAANEARQAEEAQRKGAATIVTPPVVPQKPLATKPPLTAPMRPPLAPKIDAPARPISPQPALPQATPIPPQKPVTMPKDDRPIRVSTPPPALPQATPIEPTRPRPGMPTAPERLKNQRPELPVRKPMPATPPAPLKQFQKPTPVPGVPTPEPREKKKRD